MHSRSRKPPIVVLLTAGAALLLALLLIHVVGETNAVDNEEAPAMNTTVDLPEPNTTGDTQLEQALANRRSVREYGPEPISLSDAAQLLWSAQGITGEGGKRTAPSAGATFPLELYLVAERVDDLEPGAYHYSPQDHRLRKTLEGSLAGRLSAAALGQAAVRDAAANIVVAAAYGRTEARYGDRGRRYVHMEVGHAGQNVYLQCETLGLATVVVGAFDDDQVHSLLQLPGNHEPLYIIPVGRAG